MKVNEEANKNRDRHYGLRINDIVKSDGQLKQFNGTGKVVEFNGLDNNSACVEVDGKRIPCVAEWLTIVTKAEDILKQLTSARTQLKEYRSILGKTLYRLKLIKNNPSRYYETDHTVAHNSMLLATKKIKDILKQYPQLKQPRTKQTFLVGNSVKSMMKALKAMPAQSKPTIFKE
jgi:hypothetical protein